MHIQTATLQDDRGLVHQYFALRQRLQVEKAGRGQYASGPIPGDECAGFLLAVEDKDAGPKMIGGLRLNEVKAGGQVPIDKVEDAQLEAMFPGLDVRRGYSALYVDGAYVEPGYDFTVLYALLKEVQMTGNERKYDLAYFLPSEPLAKAITRFYTHRGIPVNNWGPREYVNYEGGYEQKVLLGIILNEELQAHLEKLKRETPVTAIA